VTPGPLDHADVVDTAHRVGGPFKSLLEGIIDQL
jgi:hypothetical protein